MHISEGERIIRTTPTQSPRGDRGFTRDPPPAGPSTPTPHKLDSRKNTRYRSSDRPSPPEDLTPTQEANVSETRVRALLAAQDETRQPLPLPPILKNNLSNTEERQKLARIVSPDVDRWGRGSDTAPPVTSQSRLTSPSPEEGGGKNVRKKTAFVASVAGNRKRPSMPRRKSSQSQSQCSSGNSDSRTSPKLGGKTSPSVQAQPSSKITPLSTISASPLRLKTPPASESSESQPFPTLPVADAHVGPSIQRSE